MFFSSDIRVSFFSFFIFFNGALYSAVSASVIQRDSVVGVPFHKLKRCQMGGNCPRRTVLIPHGRSPGATTPKDIPLPPPFRNDGTEYFSSVGSRIVIQELLYKIGVLIWMQC